MPSPGFRSPVLVRGFDSTGLIPVEVHNIEDLQKVKNGYGAIISSSTGKKKKIAILKKSIEMKITILNLNAQDSIKKIEDFIEQKKKKSTEVKKLEKKEKEKEQKKEEEKKEIKQEEKELTDDQKKESDKKEKDKVLTKRV